MENIKEMKEKRVIHPHHLQAHPLLRSLISHTVKAVRVYHYLR